MPSQTHAEPPTWVVGIGPPLEQIERDYLDLVLEANEHGSYGLKHRQCAKDALALIEEVKRLRVIERLFLDGE